MKKSSFSALKSLFAGCALLITFFSGNVAGEELVIVANKAFPSLRMSLARVKDIYLGEKTMEESVRIIPVDQKEPGIRDLFTLKILKTDPEAYESYWFKKAYQDGVVPPVQVESSREVLLLLKREVGGVGYVWKKDLKNEDEVKVLLSVEVGNK